MSAALTQKITLEEFLLLPHLDESPAWEYAEGVATQKPIPKFRHSVLQKQLLIAIDTSSDNYTALPELRCTFAGRSVVPDITVIAWHRVQVNDNGEPEDNFLEAPDWTIEILSPDQNATKVIGNILHCLKYGTQLGWFIDLSAKIVIVFLPKQQPIELTGQDVLPVPNFLDLQITVAQLFGWLKPVKN